jgi:hypothetical protein
MIHATAPPGVDTMRQLRDQISYVAEMSKDGARFRIRTGNPAALFCFHISFDLSPEMCLHIRPVPVFLVFAIFPSPWGQAKCWLSSPASYDVNLSILTCPRQLSFF